MKTTASLEDVEASLKLTSARYYAGNLVFKRAPEQRGHWVHFTLTVKSSAGPGSRRSYSGRRISAACWHAHRDVMLALFARIPDVRLVSASADYHGREHFLRSFEATGDRNIGSMVQPMAYRDACDCEA